MSIPVFRNGTWVQFDVPDAGTSIWSKSLTLQAASLYASAITKGHSKEKSLVLAECYGNKQLYGVTYSKQIETELQNLFV